MEMKGRELSELSQYAEDEKRTTCDADMILY